MTDIRKDSVTLHSVDENGAKQRLDNYLVKLLRGVPKSHIYRIIRSGEVRVNKGRAKAETKLAAGDELRIPPIRVAERPAQDAVPGCEFPIVYEDDALLVINKPAGVAVHGGSGVSFGVIEQLRRARPEARYLELVHRLDRETSGLLMIAKKRPALVKLHEMIRNDVPQKRYFALGLGSWPADVRHVKLPLHRFHTPTGERMVRVDADQGIYAHTIFTVQQRYHGFTLVEALLRTGRTHQIRVHMKHAGHSIAGDAKYGDEEFTREVRELGGKRLFLHAYQLKIELPDGQPLELQAEVDDMWAQTLERLGA